MSPTHCNAWASLADMTTLPEHLKHPLAQLLLSIADDKLILGHRNSDWTGLGPILEEDIAFSHLAQDEIAHAQALYEIIGGLLGKKTDDLAFGRTAQEFRCAAIVEVPDEFDWAAALCRQFFCDHFDSVRLGALSNSSYKPLADLSRRLAAEEAVHVQHSDSWIKRLGRGGEESKQRMQKALDALAPLASMLAEPTDGQEALIAAGIYPIDPRTMFDNWKQSLSLVTNAAGLRLELAPPQSPKRGGRHGLHSEHLKPLLDEMCEVYRMEPGAAW